MSCERCKYYQRGFLSEGDECGYFHEPYKWFIPKIRDMSDVHPGLRQLYSTPKWCPRKIKNKVKKLFGLLKPEYELK